MIQIEENTALALIAAEREKQVRRGWGPEGDDKLIRAELTDAAAAHQYVGDDLQLRALGILLDLEGVDDTPEFAADVAADLWPFKQRRWNEAGGWFPPATPLENYVKAAAFLAAEIDRILRKQQTPQT